VLYEYNTKHIQVFLVNNISMLFKFIESGKIPFHLVSFTLIGVKQAWNNLGDFVHQHEGLQRLFRVVWLSD
jgi:hypothetical protein